MDQQTPQQRIGKVFRTRRKALGHSQDSYADVIGMHRAYYSAVERGERNLTLDTMLKVAGGLEVCLSKIFAEAGL